MNYIETSPRHLPSCYATVTPHQPASWLIDNRQSSIFEINTISSWRGEEIENHPSHDNRVETGKAEGEGENATPADSIRFLRSRLFVTEPSATKLRC